MHTYPAEFVLTLGAGVHESLSDDGQRGVHDFRHVDVEDEVGILQNVYPKTQRKAVEERDKEAPCYCNIPASDQLLFQFIKQVLERWRRFTREHILEAQSSAVHSNNRDRDKAFFSPTFI